MSQAKKSTKGFSEQERAAMKARAKELKAEERASKNRAIGENDVLAKIAELAEPEQSMVRRLHEIITTTAPSLWPRLWYGMPAYAKDGKVLCFYQSAEKFNTRYASFGFSDVAQLDEGAFWPTAFALKELTPEVEERIRTLVKRAVGE
jgi:uncharacterized protein YdhG (YjbR/CyaY superfamily)